MDKGYCGTSGATAAGGNNLWLIPRGPAPRGVGPRVARWPPADSPTAEWMFRVLATSWDRIEQLAAVGLPVPRPRPTVSPCAAACRAPSTCGACAARPTAAASASSTTTPPSSCTTDADGVVDGARGIARQDDGRPWRISAGAVVLATGGTAFLSGTFGTNVDTGDGLLMAAELGRRACPAWSSPARTPWRRNGACTPRAECCSGPASTTSTANRLATELGLGGRQDAQRALAEGRRVFARLDRAPAAHAPDDARRPTQLLPAAGQGRHRPVHHRLPDPDGPRGNRPRHRRPAADRTRLRDNGSRPLRRGRRRDPRTDHRGDQRRRQPQRIVGDRLGHVRRPRRRGVQPRPGTRTGHPQRNRSGHPARTRRRADRRRGGPRRPVTTCCRRCAAI